MGRKAAMFCSLVVALGALAGCSKQQSPASKQAATPPDRIQGRAQILTDYSGGGAADAALNAGRANAVFIWDGSHRYRLFLRAPVELVHGDEYVAEGVYAQKVIDEIGDPDMGKNGYPLRASCERVVKKAWGALAFDEIDSKAEILRATVKRYPARAVFLVTRIRPVTASESSLATKKAIAGGKELKEISVPAEKQSALLIKGATVQPAPLWQPDGGKARCRVLIDGEGKIAELQTGQQLCETVSWDQFQYKPMMQGGNPVKVSTEIEVSFEPKK